MEAVVNKVAESGIISFDLVDLLPKEEVVTFDLKDHLFMQMILKEKDFRAALLTHGWEQYENKGVAVICSADAIIPMWAFMLVASYLQPVASSVFFGDTEQMKNKLIIDNLSSINIEEYVDKRVVIKGCGDTPIPETAYITITFLLRPVVKSLMYGEPCSTVPVYKKK